MKYALLETRQSRERGVTHYIDKEPGMTGVMMCLQLERAKKFDTREEAEAGIEEIELVTDYFQLEVVEVD